MRLISSIVRRRSSMAAAPDKVWGGNAAILLTACPSGVGLRSFRRIIHHYIEPPDHHLIVSWITPANVFLRIGVVLVLNRVVEVRRHDQLRAFRNRYRLFQPIDRLPVEAEFRNPKQSLAPA